jgi:hypothetical protein
MPKPLKLALILFFILAIFAPEASILAQDSRSEGETSYLPTHSQWSQSMSNIPVRILNFFKQAIPTTPAEWHTFWDKTMNTAKNVLSQENLKNFFHDTGIILGKIKDFLVSLYHQFY